jgi:hypothetical protein
MDKLDFRIAAEAVDFLRRFLSYAGTGEALVLTISPQLGQGKTLNVARNDAKFSDDELAVLATDFLASLPSTVQLHWTIGAMRKSRLPGQEFVLIDGIECFIPDELKSVVDGRVLRLRNGELVFDPELDPPSGLLLSRPEA